VGEYQEFELSKRYHDALLAWQKRNFPDFSLLTRYWDKHFPDEQPFALSVKLAPLKNELIETGMFIGQPKLNRASAMKGNMLYSALRIIKAQCSTELGSIQQHLCTLDQTTSERAKFSILRIMAEELRHAYQMFWVLSHDETWSTAGIRNLADETMDELLAMETGTHVLDAFNIPFHDPLDNIVFAFLVDRVGKYQLSMQKIFSYAPMAKSMPPMLKEESFHLHAGHDLLKEVAVAAAMGNAVWDLKEIQKRINAWFPRAVEMFGSPEGGMTNVVFGFKDKLNGESATSYIAEVNRLLRRINVAIVTARRPELSREKIDSLVDEHGEADLLRFPDTRFFRIRGPDDVAYEPYDTEGRRLQRGSYLDYLAVKLPASLLESAFFHKYKSAFQAQSSKSPH
jgi:benzoyl-CoA 2,3-dioxygenase component B